MGWSKYAFGGGWKIIQNLTSGGDVYLTAKSNNHFDICKTISRIL